MEKQKKWQFWLIAAVLLITLYNILPTIFWYSKPLKEPINKSQATEIAVEAIERVNSLEQEAVKWIQSFAKNLHIKPLSIKLDENSPQLITVAFANEKDANVFQRFLPTAGSMIPFVPAQLKLAEEGADLTNENGDPIVVVERQIGIRLDPKDVDNLFTFSKKILENGDIAPFYQNIVYDRVTSVVEGIVGPSPQAKQIEAIVQYPKDKRFDDLALLLAKEINTIKKTFGTKSPVAKRYFATFTQTERKDKAAIITQFIAKLESLKNKAETKLSSLETEISKQQDEGKLIDASESQKASLAKKQIATLENAIETLQANKQTFESGKKPLNEEQILALFKKSESTVDKKDYIQSIDISGYHPYISSLYIDWSDDIVLFRFYPDLIKIRSSDDGTEAEAITLENTNRLLFNSIAQIARMSDETLTPHGDDFILRLNNLTNSNSILALNLGKVAEKKAEQITGLIDSTWLPSHSDLQREVYPVRSYESFLQEAPEDKQLGLVVLAPAASDTQIPEGFENDSVYIIARGLGDIVQKYRDDPNAKGNQILFDDFQALQELMANNGFINYPGKGFGIASEFKKDYIFQLSDYYNDLISATRENFYVKGEKRNAILEFTDLEQRMLAQNQMEDREQEDLVKWQEEYQTAQVDLNPAKKFLIPPPTKNPYLSNLKLTAAKYFRGDDRKILKWGLDLSGGKTVRIGLRDQNNRTVDNPDDINQVVNELYTRINNMGVSERTIRTEGNSVILDFPGSQAFSASELVKASAMYFHIVNEKFSPTNQELAPIVNSFLQEVWNESVVTNRKDIESINEIAWRHLGGDPENPEVMLPKSENAQILYENGLRLPDPRQAKKTSAFDDTLSMITKKRGDGPSEWEGQTQPLMIVFHNYALEGSSLTDIHAGYDPKFGNMLMFSVKNSFDGKSRQIGSPRQDLYNWTSQFAEDSVAGTPREAYRQGGWRMAVILNGEVVSAPSLAQAISSQASIHGRFTQREINQLAADLKAGSLSFTPKILSEMNVSPELGKEERAKGIMASIIALTLVIVAMVGVYRFAGVVACIAVLVNLLIMWGVLQSIGAALTLPGIAGIVLTIGMAVDANVLVFERIREEFAVSKRLSSAIHAGYRKAFSAIIDSNLTTLMAAVILIQFDSGPIKGFAVVLIIGILSSMFTALFMTRYFFAGWVQNPKHKELKMAKLFKETKINFLKYAKAAFMVSLVVIALGTFLLIKEKNTIFGMDFTGGYSLMVDLEEKPDTNYRLEAYDALIAAGATPAEIEIRELSRPNQLRIQMGISVEEEGHPFYGMPEEEQGKFLYNYQSNPRISWVVTSLAKDGLNIQEVQLTTLENNWSTMSGQLSDVMRNNALMALSVALVGILLYITFRFEFKYAIGAVFALAHDVWITLGIVALFHLLGFSIEINLQAIAAIMTIIGYSLNDTIIVFDRIREEVRLLRKLSFTEVINHSLNITLNRTIMTSGTTLLVLMSLVLFGGESIFGFSLIMTIGVLVGTFSSLFIASPVMLWVHNHEFHYLDTSKKKAEGKA